MKELIIHNGKFAYQYVLDGVPYWNDSGLIELLAKKLGIEIVKEGNGCYNYGETPVDWKGNKL